MKKLQHLRSKIDKIDDEISWLLDKRAGVAKEISNLKKRLNLPIEYPERESEILERLAGKKFSNIHVESIQKIFSVIIDEIKTIQ